MSCHKQKVQMQPGRQMVVLITKNYLFGNYFAGFSGTARELLVPAQPPNTHPRPHLLQKEPTYSLNFPRCGTILGVQNVTTQTTTNAGGTNRFSEFAQERHDLGVQNVTLYYKIDTVIQLFHWLYKLSLAQRLCKTLYPLFLYQIEPEISTPEKRLLYSAYFVIFANKTNRQTTITSDT